MAMDNEDDKPTVVLDLNALKKQKLKQEEDLASMASDLEFNVTPEISGTDPEVHASEFLKQRRPTLKESQTRVILFDFESNFFGEQISHFPNGYEYKIVRSVAELNQCLKTKVFQIVCFNYDVHPKAINQLSAQIKAKLPSTKTIIMAKNISLEKAKLHAQTAAGAQGYYKFPLVAQRLEKEFQKLEKKQKVA